MDRFYWLIEGELAGCSRPGGVERRGPTEADLRRHLSWLHRQGIRGILTLTEAPLDPKVLSDHPLDVLHLPVPDMTAPRPDQLVAALDFIDFHRSRGNGVVVHCLMGQGRTATVLGAYLIRGGLDSQDAVAQLRTICPGALPSPDQERALRAFAGRRDWIL